MDFASGCLVMAIAGFTVNVTVLVELPLLLVALMVNVVSCAVVVLLVKIPLMDCPEPVDADMPLMFVVLSLDQLYVVPTSLLMSENTIGVIDDPLQMVCVNGVADNNGTTSALPDVISLMLTEFNALLCTWLLGASTVLLLSAVQVVPLLYKNFNPDSVSPLSSLSR